MQHGVELEPAESLAFPGRTFESLGVGDRFAQHLKTAADPHHPAAVAQMTLEVLRPPVRSKPCQIRAYELRTREDDQVGAAEIRGVLCIAEVNLRVPS